MADVATATRGHYGPNLYVFDDYVSAALTTGTNKKEWIVPFNCGIVDVIVDSAAAGSGGTSTIIDVNRNGTTIFTTQGNRPTLLLADTGMYTTGKWEVEELRAGDILAYDVDQITTTAGPTRTSIAIIVVKR